MNNYFTYIVGGITIVGVILQLFDLFKRIEKTRNVLTLVFLGMFLGSFLSAFNTSNIKLDVTFNFLMVLEVIIFIITVISTIISYHSVDENKREIVNTVAVISFVFFVFILVFGNLAVYGLDSIDESKINQQELIILSKYNMEKENIERSVMYLDILKSRLQENDVRRTAIDLQIDSLKKVQIKLK
jgi:cytochrome bd-type quinol oxidase subunit 2